MKSYQFQDNFIGLMETFFFYKKHYGFSKAFKMWGLKMIKALLKTIFYLLIFNKKYRIYLARFLGTSSAFLGIKPWYRPKIKN